MRKPALVLLGLLPLLGACSTRNWYEGGRSAAIQRCNTQPPAEYQRCMDQVNQQHFDDYEKARKAPPAKKEIE